MNDKHALLPCPFCGHDTPEFERMGSPKQSCIVICGMCGCRHESSDENARNGDSWNTRAQATELARITAERDALRADAERYRWLRAHKPFTLTGFGYSEAQIEHWSNTQNEAKLDAAIDAARAHEKQK